ncbi:unnamed protein product [Pylaiella littoralis]
MHQGAKELEAVCLVDATSGGRSCCAHVRCGEGTPRALSRASRLLPEILTALQILGRGNCLDINQLSSMSKSMAAATFHKFCKNFAKEMFEEHIYLPTGTYQDEVMDCYRKLGFTGAIGSTDFTHVGWGMCPFTLGRSFTGKEGFPTLAFEVTVDHAGRAMGVTQGFTGAINDKTIVRYDAAVQTIRNKVYKDREFKLRKADGTEFTRKGCYLTVENGCHEWVTLTAPSKYPGDVDDAAFSKMLESVRKDVECFVGMKGRFRILKLRLAFHYRKDIDNIFFTCGILHNMLHSFDGMSAFKENVDWAGSAGLHDPKDHAPDTDCTSVGPRPATDPEEYLFSPQHAKLKGQLIEIFSYRKKTMTLSGSLGPSRVEVIWMMPKCCE